MKSIPSFLITVLIIVGISFDCFAVVGKWRGDLNMGVAKMPLVFNFKESPEGKTVATMDSPNQNAKGIPLEVAYCSEDSISLECKMIGASYAGKITPGKIEGTFSQSGYKFPLVLTPEEALTERRPQTPEPPFPYIEKDTVFTSYDGTELAGTVTIPEASAGDKIPVVVMVTGSGPQNRDEEIFEHRPFAVIADYLARNGVASFRYDDRGTASSKGNYAEATIDTFKSDAQSALKFVRTFEEFGKSGIMGHSEGGTLAILIAAEDTPDFIISLAGVSTPGSETLIEQNAHSLDKLGVSASQKESTIKLIRIMYDMIKEQYISGTSNPIDVDAVCKEYSLDVPPVVVQSIRQNMKTRNAYFDSLVSLDPTESLKKIKCPVLALNGTKDMQVNADRNLNAFEKCVKDVEIKRMEGLNHLFQHADTGEITEYGNIKETISPEVLEIILEYIKRK